MSYFNFSPQDWADSDPGSWLREYPVTVVQFLTFLYHNVEQFSVVSSSQDFVEHLVAVPFPQGKQVRIVSTDGSALQVGEDCWLKNVDYKRETLTSRDRMCLQTFFQTC